MKKWYLSLLILALCLTLVSCQKQSADKPTEGAGKTEQKGEEAKKDGGKKEVTELVYGITSSPEGKFNPLFSNTQYDGYVNKLVYASLLQFNSKIELEPSLAEKYEMKEEGKTVVFTLRDGLKFHDGKPLTSKDVLFTLNTLASADYKGDLQSYVSSIVGFEKVHKNQAQSLEGVICPDDKTVEIHFTEPYSPVLSNIGTLGILPAHIWEGTPVKEWPNKTELMSKPIGAGPYKLAEFKTGEYAKMSANEDYFKGAPKLKTLTFKLVNEDTVSAELLKGSIDLADLSSVKKDDQKTLEEGGIIVKKYPNSKIQYMGMNLRDERLKDVNLRTAFAYGIDREAIVSGLLEGNGIVIDTPMVPSLWSYPKEGLVKYKFDEQKAKEYLKKAGYEDTNGNGIVDKDGKDLELTLVVPTGDIIREKTGTIIQENLKKIGVGIKLEMLEFKATMAKVVGNHEFELYLMGNTLEADPDPTPYWYSTQASDEKGVFGWNIVSYKSEEADRLMDENRKAVDQAQRTKILNDFGKLLNKDLPWIPLYASDIVKAYNKGLSQYEPNTFVDFYNVEKWELKK